LPFDLRKKLGDVLILLSEAEAMECDVFAIGVVFLLLLVPDKRIEYKKQETEEELKQFIKDQNFSDDVESFLIRLLTQRSITTTSSAQQAINAIVEPDSYLNLEGDQVIFEAFVELNNFNPNLNIVKQLSKLIRMSYQASKSLNDIMASKLALQAYKILLSKDGY
jgi:hypothetical protein